MKICIIITGDVRDCFMKEKIKEIFKNYDVFIGSYIEHKKYIDTIGKNNYSHLIDKNNDIRLPNFITKERMQQNMLQWLHLDNIINNFKDKLLKYDVILKYRFDYNIDNIHFLDKIITEPNTLHNNSDLIFYSDSKLFVTIFKTYYNNLHKYTYDINRCLNDDTFKTSWKSEPALQLYLKDINVISKKSHFCGTIIRGNYNKVHCDGNKKLYTNNKLNGKFSI